MRSLTEHLRNYGAYHRDPRNIATHFVGIPMIVFAVQILLSRPEIAAGPLILTPALVGSLLAALFYLRLDRRFGVTMALLLALGLWGCEQFTSLTQGPWLTLGFGLFVIGWIFQFVGHIFEGRKPAFVDDLAGLIIGPLFVVAEAGFLLGLRRDLRQAITALEPAAPNN